MVGDWLIDELAALGLELAEWADLIGGPDPDRGLDAVGLKTHSDALGFAWSGPSTGQMLSPSASAYRVVRSGRAAWAAR